MFPIMSEKLDLPLDMKDEVLRSLTDTVTPFIMLNKVTKKIELSGEVRGTVYSGHPTRTTWGNTLRVLSYIEYIMKDCKLPYTAFVSGDDATMIIEKQSLSLVI